MQKGMELQELAAEVKRVEEMKRDFIAPTTKLWMKDGDGDMWLEIEDKGKFRVNDVAHSQFSQKLGIPKAYYDRMRREAPDLLATNVNCWLRTRPERRLVRTLDGTCRAYLSDKFGILFDNALLANAVLPVLHEYPGMTYPSTQLTEKRMYIQAVYPKLAGEVKVGEVVQAGAIFSNSEVGFGQFMAEALIYVLSCQNGLVRPQSVRRRHVSRRLEDDLQAFYRKETVQADLRAFVMKIQDTVRQTFNEASFMDDLRQLRETTERKIPVGDVEDTVEEVSKRYGLNDDEKGDFLSRLIEGADLSQWGVAQAVTNLANDEERNYDRVVELERIGGQIVDLDEKEWSAVTGSS